VLHSQLRDIPLLPRSHSSPHSTTTTNIFTFLLPNGNSFSFWILQCPQLLYAFFMSITLFFCCSISYQVSLTVVFPQLSKVPLIPLPFPSTSPCAATPSTCRPPIPAFAAAFRVSSPNRSLCLSPPPMTLFGSRGLQVSRVRLYIVISQRF